MARYFRINLFIFLRVTKQMFNVSSCRYVLFPNAPLESSRILFVNSVKKEKKKEAVHAKS